MCDLMSRMLPVNFQKLQKQLSSWSSDTLGKHLCKLRLFPIKWKRELSIHYLPINIGNFSYISKRKADGKYCSNNTSTTENRNVWLPFSEKFAIMADFIRDAHAGYCDNFRVLPYIESNVFKISLIFVWMCFIILAIQVFIHLIFLALC